MDTLTLTLEIDMDMTLFIREMGDIVKLLGDGVNYKIEGGTIGAVVDIDKVGNLWMPFGIMKSGEYVDQIKRLFSNYYSKNDVTYDGQVGWHIKNIYHCSGKLNQLSEYLPAIKLWNQLADKLDHHTIDVSFCDNGAIRFDPDHYENRQIITIKPDGIYISGKKYSNGDYLAEVVELIESKSKTPVTVMLKVEKDSGRDSEAQEIVLRALAENGFSPSVWGST